MQTKDEELPGMERRRIYFEGQELDGGTYLTLPSATIRSHDAQGAPLEFAPGQIVEVIQRVVVDGIEFRHFADPEKPSARIHKARAQSVHMRLVE